MLGTLFNVRVNWGYYFLGLIGIFVFFPDISLFRFIAYAITLHQFILVFYAFNHMVPVRYLAGSLAALQYLAGPANAYGGLDEQMYFKYQMQVSEDVYFAYAIPATVLFIAGLHIFGKPSGEVISRVKVMKYVRRNPGMPYILIIVGFAAPFITEFFPSSLANVFYITGGFKFVGLFMLLIGTQKVQVWAMALVIGSIIVSSLKEAMFHDLITWTFFVLSILAIKYKPTLVTKAGFGLALLITVISLQQLKSVYRSNITHGRGNLAQFQESFETVQEGSEDFFGVGSTAQSNTRINQGFIVTYAMNHIPAEAPFANGEELKRILEAAFLPRIIAPDKLKAGDNDFLYKYTGIALNKATSMSISALGDGYVNFGAFGGSIFMFFWGLSFNVVLHLFQKLSMRYYVILLFIPLIYYYPIRPDTALQTGLGHMVKSAFFVWLMLQLWGRSFRIPEILKLSLETDPQKEPEITVGG